MGYLHINNLYKDPTVLLFKELYALEKIHGTSAHISYAPAHGALSEKLSFFSGGESHERFVGLFDTEKLLTNFRACAFPADKTVTVYGEAYGGKQQGMSNTYGKELKFIVFDVQVGDCWLDVPNAASIAEALGLDFVSYVKVATNLAILDAERDKHSIQALRNGVTTVTGPEMTLVNPRPREGIVLRPLKEMTMNNGNRVIAKHKGAAFAETASPRPIEADPTKLAQLAEADAIANEWVTPMRLQHVLDKIPDHDMSKMREILNAMVEDVTREGMGEIDWSKDPKGINKAITRRTSVLYKEYLNAKIREDFKQVREIV